MCVTLQEYTCGHQEIITRDCLKVKNLKSIQSRNMSKRRRCFNNLFCRQQKPEGAEIVCNAPTGLQSSRLPCPGCVPRPRTAEDVRQIAEWKNKQRKKRDRNVVGVGVRVLDQSEIERRRLNTKWQWLCTRCRDEGRTVESWHRRPHGGPCCARGVDEFDAWEQEEGYCSLYYDPPHFASRAHRPRDSSPPPPPPKKRDLDLLSAKLDASRAARDYGHSDGDQDSHISPELVRDFISMSGTDTRSLPPPPPEPQPYYEDAGIDSERWKTQRRTQRGSYPAPSQPPTDPLPVKPLRPQRPVVLIPDKLYVAGPLRRISGQTDLRNPVPGTPEGTHSVPKKAVSMPRHTGQSTLSMLPIPTLSSWSAGPPADPRKIAKDEDILIPYPGGQFKVSFSDTPSRSSRQATQTSLPPAPSNAERMEAAVPSSSRPSRTTLVNPTPSRHSGAGSCSNHPRLSPPSERISPTPDLNGISPLSSPVSDPSPASPVSNSVPSVVAEMNQHIKDQIDDVIKDFSTASEGSDEGEKKEERSTWYE
ncbi:hypothetical protein NA56DRAFT_743992 [Hyaloscypha hepaticicola]|uniref:Uncharacterized protein n=1 Tax=Hyaloscypha hepaticicola TaxID=2082293 RepID=A0A2J6QK67_9HELO|nr:hypothetical protein NA56DRAFT_743992 [Hyaloscypha hepaticicola]